MLVAVVVGRANMFVVETLAVNGFAPSVGVKLNDVADPNGFVGARVGVVGVGVVAAGFVELKGVGANGAAGEKDVVGPNEEGALKLREVEAAEGDMGWEGVGLERLGGILAITRPGGTVLYRMAGCGRGT
jgi:hypothetical protein